MSGYRGDPKNRLLLASNAIRVAQSSMGNLVIPAREQLLIVIHVTGYVSTGITSLRFNGDIGANYYSRFLTVAIASTTFTNVANNSATSLALAPATTTLGHDFIVTVQNTKGVEKVCSIQSRISAGTGAAATSPVIGISGGSWVNTTAQITSVTVFNAGTFAPNSTVSIYGFDP